MADPAGQGFMAELMLAHQDLTPLIWRRLPVILCRGCAMR
jgi:hypothetical protein